MKKRLTLLAIAALALAACITINVYFPEAAIKDLSQQIEAQVERQATAGAVTEPTPLATPAATPGTGGLISAILSLGASTAYAAEEVPAPEITNPAIRTIIDARAKRLEGVNRFKSLGVVGESNQAVLELRSLDALTDLRERAEVQRLVKAENADREQLYKEIAAAKNVDLSQLPKIRATYAETLREKARPGDWIQLPDGTWNQKK